MRNAIACPIVKDPKLSDKAYEANVTKWLTVVQRGSGHCSREAFVRALGRKQVPEKVIEIAQKFWCDACEENTTRTPMHPVVSLEAMS